MKKTLIILVLLFVGFFGSAYAEVIKLKCEITYTSTDPYEYSEESYTSDVGYLTLIVIDTDNLTLRYGYELHSPTIFENLQITDEIYKIREETFENNVFTKGDRRYLLNITIYRYTGFLNYTDHYKDDYSSYLKITKGVCSETKQLF